MKKKIFLYLSIIAMIYANFIALQASTHVARRIIATKPLYVCYNLLFLFAVYCFINLFFSKIYRSGMVFSVLCTVWGLVNDYVYALHGQVFTWAEIVNAKTAAGVIGKDLLFKKNPLIFGGVILLIFMFNMTICFWQRKFIGSIDREKTDKQKYFTQKLLFAAVGIGILFILAFPAKGKMQEIILKDWTSRNTCIEEGYPMYFYANIFQSMIKITKPDGYEEQYITDYEVYADEDSAKDNDGSRDNPDIILILNEAFFDLSTLMKLDTDIPYLENYYGLQNAVRGYAVTPNIGGGTNRSEFELLTSNTTYLLGELTPFNVLNMSYSSSIVSNLEEDGYYTIAAHPVDKGNYNRNQGYSNMGFDEKYFQEDFSNYEYYGKREWMTDRGAYRNLITWYEGAKAYNENVFAYLLTMQNHGDYGKNDEEDVLVHVQDYNGGMEKELNEYLSCIYLSDMAFKELTDYYASQDEPVIICMVGDHAPNMVREIADVDGSPEKEILARATPFIIWANYDINERDMGIISVNGLVPLLLDEAGVEMISYYQYILNMQEKVPMVGSFGQVMDAGGEIYSYYDDTEYKDMIWKYIYLSYNNLQEESVPGWFHLQN